MRDSITLPAYKYSCLSLLLVALDIHQEQREASVFTGYNLAEVKYIYGYFGIKRSYHLLSLALNLSSFAMQLIF